MLHITGIIRKGRWRHGRNILCVQLCGITHPVKSQYARSNFTNQRATLYIGPSSFFFAFFNSLRIAIKQLKEENAEWEVEGKFPKLTDAAEVEKAIVPPYISVPPASFLHSLIPCGLQYAGDKAGELGTEEEQMLKRVVQALNARMKVGISP